jgi:hypothetical protein
VEQDDWPSMMSGKGTLRAKLPGLADANEGSCRL